MRRITRAVAAWTVLWVVGIWVLDPASTVGGKPPAWILFECWAIGFVVLGAIWNRQPVAGSTVPDRPVETGPVGRVTWVILGWTLVWIVVFGIWALDPNPSEIGQGPGSGGLIVLKPPAWALFDIWLIGFVVLGGIWLVLRRRSLRSRWP